MGERPSTETWRANEGGALDRALQEGDERFRLLHELERPVFAYTDASGEIVLRDESRRETASRLMGFAPALPPHRLGDESFLRAHAVRYPYVAGAMAGGIASAELVVAMAREGMMAFFGAGGLDLGTIEDAITEVQSRLRGSESYGFNLLHDPGDPPAEMATAELYVRRKVSRVCASGYMRLTPPLVYYRASGLTRRSDGSAETRHRLFAKISRTEVAREFLSPPPRDLLDGLVRSGKLTADQAELASRLPLAEDVTAEGDSGGHTDRQPTIPLLSAISELRDRIAREHGYHVPVRVGCAGGIATPATVAAAFAAGAAYVLGGSIHQACLEAATSPRVKEMLARAEIGHFEMAPAGDMLELGARVQVLKHRTLFAARARKLYDLYREFGSLEELPPREREQLERRTFRMSLDDVWEEVRAHLARRSEERLRTVSENPKQKMGAVFRWYLHMSHRWAVTGEPDREVDYQIWCGPAMAAFNGWVRGSFLEAPASRRIAVVAKNLLFGAAYSLRTRLLVMQGVPLPEEALRFRPRPF